MQQSGVQKPLEILLDDWGRLWGVNLEEPAVDDDCSYCEMPTSLPVGSELLRTDMEYDWRWQTLDPRNKLQITFTGADFVLSRVY